MKKHSMTLLRNPVAKRGGGKKGSLVKHPQHTTNPIQTKPQDSPIYPHFPPQLQHQPPLPSSPLSPLKPFTSHPTSKHSNLPNAPLPPAQNPTFNYPSNRHSPSHLSFALYSPPAPPPSHFAISPIFLTKYISANPTSLRANPSPLPGAKSPTTLSTPSPYLFIFSFFFFFTALAQSGIIWIRSTMNERG